MPLLLRVCCGLDHATRVVLPLSSGLDEGLAWSGCAGEHSPIYLRAVFVSGASRTHGCPLFSSLAIECAGRRATSAASLRLCVCVCGLPCFCRVGLKRFELSGE